MLKTNQKAFLRGIPIGLNHATFNYLLILSFFLLGFIGIINHELWRDEMQAWLIARDSLSIFELVGNLRNEGHPGLWHLCLYLLSRLTHNPLIMQIFHLLIATAAVSLFVFFSPFKPFHKALFTFGYFPFYEYSILSRNYNIGVLFVFLFCTLFPKRNQYLLALSLILALLANTNAYGFIISVTLALTLLFEICIDKNINRCFYSKKWSLLTSSIIVIFGWMLSFLQMIQPSKAKEVIRPLEYVSQSHLSKSGTLHGEIVRIKQTLFSICESYLVLPDFSRLKFRDTNFFTNSLLFNHLEIAGISAGTIFACFLSIGLLYICCRLLINKPVALFAYVLGTLSILTFSYLVFYGYIRHHGHLFILLIACLWIAKYVKSSNIFFQSNQRVKRDNPRYKNLFLTIILFVHLISGVFAYSMDLIYPFSASKETSEYIKAHQLDRLTIVGTRDKYVSTLSGYLDKQIYYPEGGKFGSFWPVPRKELKNEQEIFDVLEELLPQSKTDILLAISPQKLESYPPELHLDALASFEGGITTENFYLYLVRKK